MSYVREIITIRVDLGYIPEHPSVLDSVSLNDAVSKAVNETLGRDPTSVSHEWHREIWSVKT